MSAAVSGTSPNNLKEVQKTQEEVKCDRFKVIGKIALKILATLSIVVGSAAAIAGTVVVMKVVIATGILAPLLVPCVTAAGHVFYFSMQLLKHDATALGAMFTLPVAAVCLSPFLLPIAVGAAPGGALIGLGAWGWSQLSGK